MPQVGMGEEVRENLTKVSTDEIEAKMQHLEEDRFDSMTGTGDTGKRYGVSNYVGQNQQMMGLLDYSVENMRGVMKEVAEDVVADNFTGYQRSQGKRGLEVPQDDQGVMPEFP